MKGLRLNWRYLILVFIACAFSFQEPLFSRENSNTGGITREQLMKWLDAVTAPLSKPSGTLTPEQLKWGEKQLKQMLKDRPAMALYVTQGDDLWNWTVRQFAGEVSGVEVGWNNTWYGPEAGGRNDRDAATTFWPPSDKIHVTVTAKYGGLGNLKNQAELKGKPKDGPMLWYDTIFELFNSQKMVRFMKVCRRAMEGKIDRETFILEIDMVENGTRKEAFDFYQNIFIKNCQEKSLPFQDSVVADELKNATELQKQFYPEDRIDELISGRESVDHYRAYGQIYDSLIVPYLPKKGT